MPSGGAVQVAEVQVLIGGQRTADEARDPAAGLKRGFQQHTERHGAVAVLARSTRRRAECRRRARSRVPTCMPPIAPSIRVTRDMKWYGGPGSRAQCRPFVKWAYTSDQTRPRVCPTHTRSGTRSRMGSLRRRSPPPRAPRSQSSTSGRVVIGQSGRRAHADPTGPERLESVDGAQEVGVDGGPWAVVHFLDEHLVDEELRGRESPDRGSASRSPGRALARRSNRRGTDGVAEGLPCRRPPPADTPRTSSCPACRGRL